MNRQKHTSSGADSTGASAITPKSETLNPWLNGIPAVADYTGCSRRLIQNWISDGQLPVKRLSKRHLLVHRENVEALINRLDCEYRERNEAEAADWQEESI